MTAKGVIIEIGSLEPPSDGSISDPIVVRPFSHLLVGQPDILEAARNSKVIGTAGAGTYLLVGDTVSFQLSLGLDGNLRAHHIYAIKLAARTPQQLIDIFVSALQRRRSRMLLYILNLNQVDLDVEVVSAVVKLLQRALCSQTQRVASRWLQRLVCRTTFFSGAGAVHTHLVNGHLVEDYEGLRSILCVLCVLSPHDARKLVPVTTAIASHLPQRQSFFSMESYHNHYRRYDRTLHLVLLGGNYLMFRLPPS